jgi:hypothetical protein
MKKETKPTENLPDKFAEFDRSFRHVANSDHAGQVPQQGYVREVQDATARGREAIAAGRRGERNFPPARQVVKP